MLLYCYHVKDRGVLNIYVIIELEIVFKRVNLLFLTL